MDHLEGFPPENFANFRAKYAPFFFPISDLTHFFKLSRSVHFADLRSQKSVRKASSENYQLPGKCLADLPCFTFGQTFHILLLTSYLIHILKHWVVIIYSSYFLISPLYLNYVVMSKGIRRRSLINLVRIV